MREFNRGGGDRFGGNKRFDNSRGPRRGDRPERFGSDRPMMHSAVCADCGRQCEVPFKPTGDKPVLCSSCFGAKKEVFGDRRPTGRDFDRPSFNRDDRREASRSSFGRDDRDSSSRTPSVDQHKQQFEMLNTKLDLILKMLAVKPASDKIVKEVKPIEVEAVVPATKTAKKVAAKKAAAPKKVVAKKAVVKKKK